MVSWRSAAPLLFIVVLIVFEERVSLPSCRVVPSSPGGGDAPGGQGDVKVMMVASLLLMGSDSGYFNVYFRDSYMAKFFRKSFQMLKPDMLVVLGDVSAKGSQLSRSKWLSVLHQLQHMLGPFLGLPLHIVVGDRDIGNCSELDPKLVEEIASSLPGLDSAGCGVFDVNNISFVSLNAIAMLCKNDLRFHVEKVIERQNQELQRIARKASDRLFESDEWAGNGDNFHRKANAISGAGPVLLLHFPLHKTTASNNWRVENFRDGLQHTLLNDSAWASVDDGSHEQLQTIPLNVTEYILQALKPRIVFSAHTRQFGDRIHQDGTREVTVPTMAWDVTDDPGFVMAAFGENEGVTVSYCYLARESYVLMVYVSLLILLISTTLIASRWTPHNLLN